MRIADEEVFLGPALQIEILETPELHNMDDQTLQRGQVLRINAQGLNNGEPSRRDGCITFGTTNHNATDSQIDVLLGSALVNEVDGK